MYFTIPFFTSMVLGPRHYVEIIYEAASMSENEATRLFVHKYTKHSYDNRDFKGELYTWLQNIYRMYKKCLTELRRNDPLNRTKELLYIDKIPMDHFVEEEFKPRRQISATYNKAVWHTLNIAYMNFLRSI